MANELLQNLMQVASQMDEANTQLEERVNALETLSQHEQEQEERLAVLESKMEHLTALLARVAALEARVSLLESVPQTTAVNMAPVDICAMDKITAIETRLSAIETITEDRLNTIEEAHAELESRIDEVESNPAFGLIDEDDDYIDDDCADEAEFASKEAAGLEDLIDESEEIATDEETGLPELEVELLEAPAEVVAAPEESLSETAASTALDESEDIATDEETGLPELEVEWEEEADDFASLVEAIQTPASEVVAPATATPIPLEMPVVSATQILTDMPAVSAMPAAQPEPQATTIADKAAAVASPAGTIVPKVDSIKKAISIGDRFFFQRELFNNDAPLYAKTIAELDAMTSLAEAEQYIAKRFAWNTESEAYTLLFNVLKRRW